MTKKALLRILRILIAGGPLLSGCGGASEVIIDAARDATQASIEAAVGEFVEDAVDRFTDELLAFPEEEDLQEDEQP